MSSKGDAAANGRSPKEDDEQDPTLDDQLDSIGWGRFQFIALIAFVLFIVADGMELVVTNVIWRALPKDDWGMDDDLRGVTVSASFLGFFVGAIFGGYVGDCYGRQPILYIHSAIFVPASVASALSGSFVQLLVTRLLVGFAMGMVLPTTVSMMAEMSPTKYRARAVIAIPGLAYATGQVLVLAAGLYLMNAYGESCAGSERSMKRYVGHCDWWRPMLAAGVIPNMIAVMLVMFNVPESPRFLLYQNKMDGVRQFVKRVAETNGAMDKVLKGGAVRELDGAETQGVTMTQQMHEILSPSMRRIMLFILVVWSLFALAVFGQSFAYPVLLERDADLSFHDQYVLLIQVAAVEIPGIAMVIWTMESPSIGRKYSVIMFAGLIPVAAVAAVISEQYGLVWFHVANILLRMFSILPYEVMYVYAAELLPTSHRNLGVSIGNGTTKLVAVAVPIALMPLLADWSGWVYVIIAAAGLLATLLLVFLGVEPSDHLPDSVLEVAEGQSTDRADFDSERRYLLDHNQRQKEEKGSV